MLMGLNRETPLSELADNCRQKDFCIEFSSNTSIEKVVLFLLEIDSIDANRVLCNLSYHLSIARQEIHSHYDKVLAKIIRQTDSSSDAELRALIRSLYLSMSVEESCWTNADQLRIEIIQLLLLQSNTAFKLVTSNWTLSLEELLVLFHLSLHQMQTKVPMELEQSLSELSQQVLSFNSTRTTTIGKAFALLHQLPEIEQSLCNPQETIQPLLHLLSNFNNQNDDSSHIKAWTLAALFAFGKQSPSVNLTSFITEDYMRTLQPLLMSAHSAESLAAGDFLFAISDRNAETMIAAFGYPVVAGYLYSRFNISSEP